MKTFNRFDGVMWHREVGAASGGYQQICGLVLTNEQLNRALAAFPLDANGDRLVPGELCKECLAHGDDPEKVTKA